MSKQKEEIQLELVKRVAQSNWSVEDLEAVNSLLTDLYIKGQDQKEKDRLEREKQQQIGTVTFWATDPGLYPKDTVDRSIQIRADRILVLNNDVS